MSNKKIIKILDKLLEELRILQELDLDKFYNKIETFPFAETEELAMHYYSLYPNLKRPYMCESAPEILWPLMSHRRGLLNHSFEESPENIARYLLVNEHFKSSLQRAALEAKRVAAELDDRIKNKDSFISNYQVEIILTPKFCISDPDKESETYADYEIINCALQEMLPEMRYYDWKGILAKDSVYEDNWFDCCGITPDKLNGKEVCYPMHELWEHTCWSIPDILRINEICTTIDVDYWHDGEHF